MPGVGDLFDVVGVFYCTVKGDVYGATGYAAAVFIGAGVYYHNASNAARYYAMGRYGDDQMEFLIRESLDNIDPREVHRFSVIADSRTEAEQILGQIISENSHRIMTDQIYDAAGSVIRQGVAGDIVAARQIVEDIAAFAPRLGAQSAQYIRPQFVSYLNSISDDVLRRKILTQIDELVPTGGLTNLLDDLADPAFRQALGSVDFAWVRAWEVLLDDADLRKVVGNLEKVDGHLAKNIHLADELEAAFVVAADKAKWIDDIGYNVLRKADNTFEYINPSNNVLKWDYQHPNSYNIQDFLPPAGQPATTGKHVEAIVGDYMQQQGKTIEQFGSGVFNKTTNNPAGDIDVSDVANIIEAKKSYSAWSSKKDQVKKFVDQSLPNYLNPKGKNPILYIHEPLTAAQKADIESYIPSSVKLVNSLTELGQNLQ